MEHVVDFRDTRKESRQAKAPIAFDVEAIEIAMAVVGIDVGPETKIIVRVTDAKDGEKASERGYSRRAGTDTFVVKVRVAKKDVYEARHGYVVNNTLVHELRHVAQMQQYAEAFTVLYAAANETVGYAENPFETDARAFGRLADHTGTKATPAGTPMGDLLWALRFEGMN